VLRYSQSRLLSFCRCFSTRCIVLEIPATAPRAPASTLHHTARYCTVGCTALHCFSPAEVHTLLQAWQGGYHVLQSVRGVSGASGRTNEDALGLWLVRQLEEALQHSRVLAAPYQAVHLVEKQKPAASTGSHVFSNDTCLPESPWSLWQCDLCDSLTLTRSQHDSRVHKAQCKLTLSSAGWCELSSASSVASWWPDHA